MPEGAFSTKHLQYLQRADFVLSALPRGVDYLSAPQELRRLFRIKGTGRFDKSRVSSNSGSERQVIGDVLSGLYGARASVAFAVIGEKNGVSIQMGSWEAIERGNTSSKILDGKMEIIETTLRAQYPYIEHERSEMNLPAGISMCGLVMGTPSLKAPASDRSTQIDRLIRAMTATNWAYFVLAQPVAEEEITSLREEWINEIREVKTSAKAEHAPSPLAEHYAELLKTAVNAMEQALSVGGWRTAVYLLGDETSYGRLASIFRSVFSGKASVPEPLRVWDSKEAVEMAINWAMPDVAGISGPGFYRRPFEYQTLLTSSQLAAYAHLPAQETAGYHVREVARFDVTSHVPTNKEGIEIGTILEHGRSTDNPYRVPLKELTKHCLVVGITGSGKTNTTFHLLEKLRSRKEAVNFMVIEPAKREYRRLAKLLGEDEQLTVFTVGEEHENSAPFRINPFEIRPGTNVQTHIDLLKSVFNASFGMWTPLPQVLERAIHEVYRDKGWEAVSNTNRRAVVTEGGEDRWHPRAHPTLTDLYHKVAQLVPSLGYDKEVTRNVRTALETRINSLRVGAKGMMLDTQRSIPVEHLLNQPTVLELDGVGDDDEKAFIMGLILISLYEYYRSGGGHEDGRMHITVIEEAHRLLANVAAKSDPESGNLRGKAVETFVNMLSEVRAYGEGFLIAEQIPTKLAPDVIKNTGLKIMHRMVSVDDRQVMGGAMNLDEQQSRQVVSLGVGRAVVHGGGKYGDDNPVLVEMPEVKAKDDESLSQTTIREGWERFVEQYSVGSVFHCYSTCEQHCGALYSGCSDVRRISEKGQVAQTLSALILSLVAGGEQYEPDDMLAKTFPDVFSVIRPHLEASERTSEQARCVLTHAIYHYMEERGSQYGWKYEDVEKMTGLLLPAVLAMGAEGCISADGQSIKDISSFCQMYRDGCRLNFEPFYGCKSVCGTNPMCLYRFNVESWCLQDALAENFMGAGSDTEELAKVSYNAAERVLLPVKSEGRKMATNNNPKIAAALCFAIQNLSHSAELSQLDREFQINELLEYFQKAAYTGDD